jgi:predicted nucleic acid-binding protein
VILADVNVLIYAFRADFAQHVVCRTWLERVITGDAQFGISPRVLGAVARITTNRRSFRHPSSLSELIRRKLGNHLRRVAFPGTTAPDAEQGFDFLA